MPVKLKITKLPQLNSIVIKQEGGHFFISTPNSFIIDRVGLLELIKALVDLQFISYTDINDAMKDVIIGHQCTCDTKFLVKGTENCELCGGYIESKYRKNL